MKKFTALAASAAFVIASAGMTVAGGPVVVESEVEPVADTGAGVGGAPLLFGSLGAGGAALAVLGVAAVAAAAGGGGSSATTTGSATP